MRHQINDDVSVPPAEAWRYSEARYRSLSENIPEGLAHCRVLFEDGSPEDFIYLDVNRVFERLMGVKNIVGRRVTEVTPAIKESQPEFFQGCVRVAVTGEPERFEIHLDAFKQWFVVSVHSMEMGCFMATFENVTGRKEAEDKLLKVEKQLRQAQKMEALGQLAAGIAHDFNNTLLTLLMSLGKLAETPNLTVNTMESLKEIEQTAARATSLTRQLMLFSRQKAVRIEALDLNALIGDLLVMLRRLLGERIEIGFQCPPEAVWVNADAGMIEQVVMNLCINARDAMTTGGRLTLGVATVEIHSNARLGRFICLSVCDTGCGMDETVLGRVFEPFFTTKEVGKGTGLGLATVFEIAKQHQGWIEVESEVGRGSSFRVYFPQTNSMGAPATPAQDQEIKGGSEAILLVEDDRSVRGMVAAQLRELGYAVLEAGDGSEALKIWEEHRQEIELLFTDMMMPGNLTGLDLALRLKKEQPSLKVISSSGYSASLAESPLTAGQEIVYLPKPYEPAALAMSVRRCLDTDLRSAARNVFRSS